MITNKLIEEVKDRLVEAYHPVEIYIFGSYAWGTPDEDSDLDLLIVVEKLEQQQWQAHTFGHKVLFDIDVPKDIIVYPKAEFEEKSKHVSSIFHQIKKGERKYMLEHELWLSYAENDLDECLSIQEAKRIFDFVQQKLS